jgi:DNA invertase Pin-like site-specific DNA recombinase
MLSQAQRTTILELNAQGVSKREIARVLGISRVAVRKVLRSNSTTVPELQRPEKADPTGNRSWSFSTSEGESRASP